jgi:putative hemolysin
MVPTQANVNELLEAMRERKTHFAIAVDEYGGTDGIVTLEDVLEEIVGELQDEFEDAAPVSEERPGGIFRIDGLDNVDMLGELLHVEVDDGPYNTVAGYVVEHMGRIPQLGDFVDIDGYRLTVVGMDDLRVAVVEAVPTGGSAQREQSG